MDKSEPISKGEEDGLRGVAVMLLVTGGNRKMKCLILIVKCLRLRGEEAAD